MKLFRNIPGGTEENGEKPQSGFPISRLRYDHNKTTPFPNTILDRYRYANPLGRREYCRDVYTMEVQQYRTSGNISISVTATPLAAKRHTPNQFESEITKQEVVQPVNWLQF
jgi:hypothetical protein